MQLDIGCFVFLMFFSGILIFIDYEDRSYKPFGFRYWLGIIAGVWIVLLNFMMLFALFVSISLMIYNQFENGTTWLFLFFLLLEIGLFFYALYIVRVLVRRTCYYLSLYRKG